MHVTHVNLARGFRGGERQTELLIETLAAQPSNHVTQTLVCRQDSPMRQHLLDVKGLRFQSANHPCKRCSLGLLTLSPNRHTLFNYSTR